MSADWWQNFANNFAGDLAPLISLFGESPTKQYLSETLTFIDIFIFSMAPIGVITALVSAIRVAGGPSLRAFIGRAQEGAGVAEAELCSSTSRNVGELYTNGGIARVFGRPKILEFVHDWKPDTYSNQQEQGSHNQAGIYSFEDHLSHKHWQEQGTRISLEKLLGLGKGASRTDPKDFAEHPNLSLNIGIKKPHWAFVCLAVILGFVLQAGVLAFAALVTYKYPSEFQRDDSQIAVPAFPFVCAGTVALCIGVGMCASIIESSTYERTFKRQDQSSRLYWIQPGNQVVGDQVFDNFAYSDAKDQLTEYTTSRREFDRRDSTKRFLAKQSILVWVATTTTTVGFVLQFLGLRALHSTVSVAQLVAMVIMSIVRGLLRTRRLKEEHNLLGDLDTLYSNHELDWLAIELALEDENYFARGLMDQSRKPPFWGVTGPDGFPSLSVPPQQGVYEDSKGKAAKAYLKRVKLAQMTGAQTLVSALIIDDPWEETMVSSRMWASKLACAIQGIMAVINRRCTTNNGLYKEGVPWSLRCWIDTASETLHRHPFTSTIHLTISHNTGGIGLLGPWKADRAELESVLGLWLWSIISMQRIRRKDEKKPSGSGNSVPRSRLIHLVGDWASYDPGASLRLWLGNCSTNLQAAQLNLVDSTFYPSSLWVKDEVETGYKQVWEHDFREKEHSTPLRIFGSNVITKGTVHYEKGRSLRVLHLPSASSLEMMCAQELFTTFFSAVVPKIKEICGNTEILEGPRRSYVVNSTLSEMVENFISSGIGNYDDAIACMVPVLHSAGKLNYSSAFMAVRATGEVYRSRKEWEKAKRVLLPALYAALQELDSEQFTPPSRDTYGSGEIPVCLFHLCELYRSALSDGKRAMLFGLRGFISLFELFHSRRNSSADAGEPPKDLLLYRTIALNLAEEEKDNADILRATQELRDQVGGRCVEIVEDFHSALCAADLQGTFYALNSSILSSCAGRPVLAIAAQHGWYSVIKNLQRLGIDSRIVDHNGLNYLHYAAQRCSAPMLNDLIGDDRDLLRQVDKFGRTPLHLAAAAGRTEVIMLLTRHFSVEVNLRDHFMRSPLDNATLSNHSSTFALLEMLQKENKAETPPADGWGLEPKTLFQVACCGSIEVVFTWLVTILHSNLIHRLSHDQRMLIVHLLHISINEGDDSQKSAKILKFLEQDAYVANTWRIQGTTGLSFAAQADKADLITQLLKKCPEDSIIGTDNRGRNCLHYAVISESKSAVETLIGSIYAKKLFVKDMYGLNPLEYALKNRSFIIASAILRKHPHGQQSILPGTAIASAKGSIYFQGTDSRIRLAQSWDHPRGPTLSTAPRVSARLYSPLAVLERANEHQIFYVSNDDMLCDLLYDHSGNWSKGLFQNNGIRVDETSSLAALVCDGRCYVYYQDERRYIREIDIGNMLGRSDIPFPAIGIAAQGSAIAVLAANFERCLYFQNAYFEIEEASIRKDSRTLAWMSDRPFFQKTMREPKLELYTPLMALNRGAKILCCDKDGHVSAISPIGTTFSLSESWSIKPVDGSSTRLAVDQISGSLIYQSDIGHIRRMDIGGQNLGGDVLVASERVDEIGLDEIAMLWDEHLPQG